MTRSDRQRKTPPPIIYAGVVRRGFSRLSRRHCDGSRAASLDVDRLHRQVQVEVREVGRDIEAGLEHLSQCNREDAQRG